MARCNRMFLTGAKLAAVLLAVESVGGHTSRLYAKHKAEQVDPNNLTYRLFELLDNSHGGKLESYVLADLYKDPSKPDEEFRHVLRVDYDKNRGFGKLNLYVRSVGNMTPDQLRTYTPKQIFDFGETDLEKYVKTDPGPFGTPGDLYLRAGEDSPLASAPITDEVRKRYDDFVNLHVLPAVQKK